MMKCGIRDKGGDFWIKEKMFIFNSTTWSLRIDTKYVEHRDGLGIRCILLLRISFSTIIQGSMVYTYLFL
jgi:hypothetical protein